MSRWPLRRTLALVFGVSGAVALVVVALVAVAVVRLDNASDDRVQRYGPALLATETLAKSYSDQETGVRGYVVAGQPAFLAPYTEGRRVEQAQLFELRRLLAGRTDLLMRVEDVDSSARVWRTTVAEPAVRATRTGGVQDRSQRVVEEGKARFDDIRAAVRALKVPVERGRDDAQRSYDESVTTLRLTLLASLALILVLGGVIALALRRWVTDPLAELGREVGTVESGDLTHLVQLDDAPAEIRVLADQVDRMRIRIVQEVALAERSRDDAQRARLVVEEQALDLQRSNTELEQFAYVASHDLQEPLRKVASFCQLLERRYRGQLDDRADQYIDFAVDGAKRMQQLINDLLAFSRVGRLTAAFAPVPLDDAVGQAVRQLSAVIEETSATVTHDDLPTVSGDHTLLVQLFQNLVGNGVKFRGEEPPRVHIGVRRDGATWELSCADNGIGIEPQYADKIFVIFQRLHGRDAYGGTGIGLAMCKKIVEHHGGRMWLDTEATTGATFRWTLPVTGMPTHPEPAHESDAGADGPASSADDERMTDGAVPAGHADRGAAGGGRPG